MLTAAPPPAVPVQIAVSSSSYLLAPALSGLAIAWLEFPAAKARTPDAAYRRSGDRLLVSDGRGKTRRVVYEGGCADGLACDTVAAPAVARDKAIFAVRAEAGGGYLAAAVPARMPSRLLVRGEGGIPVPHVYAAGRTSAVWAQDGSVLERSTDDPAAPEVKLAPAAATGGRVFQVARSSDAVAWVGRGPGGTSLLSLRADGATATPLLGETRPGWTLGSLALLPGGRVAVVRLRNANGQRRAVLTLVEADGSSRVLTASSPLRGGGSYAPRVTAAGNVVAFRRRVHTRRGFEDRLMAIDTVSRRALVVARARLSEARLGDPALGGERIAWSRTALRSRSFVRSAVYVASLQRAFGAALAQP